MRSFSDFWSLVFISIFTRTKRIEKMLTGLHAAVEQLKKEIKKMTTQLQALADQVTKNTEVEASAVVLIKGIADQLNAAKDDPAAVAALAAQLKTSSDALAESITANTPVVEPPVEPPVA